MRFYIDGYNFLYFFSQTDGPLRSQREEILSFIDSFAGKLGLQITIVFDAQHTFGEVAKRDFFGALEIIYTPEKMTADDLLLEMLRVKKSHDQITIVTNDKKLASLCRQLGARTISHSAFLAFLAKKELKKEEQSQVNPQDSPAQIKRLRAIFEKKLKDNS